MRFRIPEATAAATGPLRGLTADAGHAYGGTVPTSSAAIISGLRR